MEDGQTKFFPKKGKQKTCFTNKVLHTKKLANAPLSEILRYL